MDSSCIQQPDGSWLIIIPAPEYDDDQPRVWHAELKEGEDGVLIIHAVLEVDRPAPPAA